MPSLSKEEKLNEYVKCYKDIVYFAKQYCAIQHPTKGRIKFKLFPFQEDAVSKICNNPKTIILKARQMGISTLLAMRALHLMVFKKDQNVVVIATKQVVAKEIVDKVRLMWENLPEFIKGTKKPEYNHRLGIKLANGSRIQCFSAADDSGRSQASSLLIIDEAAFINGIDELYASVFPTLSTGGQICMLSCVTPDTMVYTSDGIKRVGEFVDKHSDKIDYQIPDYNILGKDILRKGNLFHNNGIVPTKIIDTQHGSIEGSHNHKLWAYSEINKKYDWFRLDELNIGDSICVQYGMNIWGNKDDISDFKPLTSSKNKNLFNPNKLSEALCYLIGLYISKGVTYKAKSNVDDIIADNLSIDCGDDITWCFNELGLKYYTSTDQNHYTIISKELIEFLEYIGFDLNKKSHEKSIPSKIMGWSSYWVKWVLRGIFDGNGYSDDKTGMVGISLTSVGLINDLNVILNNFGILSNHHYNIEDVVKYTAGVECDRYTLEIVGIYAKEFYEKIGFNIQRKQSRNVLLSKKVYDSSDLLPNDDILNQMIESIGDEKTSILKSVGIKLGKGKINRQALLRLKKLCIEKNIINKDVDSILSENLKWTKIRSIVDSKSETYDFSLPNNINDEWDHSVIYNGFLGHQTPNGAFGFFYDQWLKASHDEGTGETGFLGIKLPWYMHPERDQIWRDSQTAAMGVKKANQEFDCFDGDTRIYTNKGLVPLKDIKVGDVVLTHDGTYQLVEGVRVIKKKGLFSIRTDLNTKKSYVTGNHRLLTLEKKWETVDSLSTNKILSYPVKKELIENNDISGLIENDLTTYSRYFNKTHGFTDDCEQWSTVYVEELDKDFEIDVYDIQVKNSHSFVTEHVIAHNCSFLGSGDTVISEEIIKIIEEKWCSEPILRLPTFDNQYLLDYWIWEQPQYGKEYVIIVDTAKGSGLDESAIEVFDAQSWIQVAEYCGQMAPDKLAQLANSIGHQYFQAFMIVESTGIGTATCLELDRLGYPNLYKAIKGESTMNFEQFMQRDPYDPNLQTGFSTNVATRPMVISSLFTAIENHPQMIRSRRITKQLRTFIWMNGKEQAAPGQFDDLIMCVGIGCLLRNTAIEYRRRLGTQATSTLEHFTVVKYDDVASLRSNMNQNPYAYRQQQIRPPITNFNNGNRYGYGGFTQNPNNNNDLDFSWV